MEGAGQEGTKGEDGVEEHQHHRGIVQASSSATLVIEDVQPDRSRRSTSVLCRSWTWPTVPAPWASPPLKLYKEAGKEGPVSIHCEEEPGV